LAVLNGPLFLLIALYFAVICELLLFLILKTNIALITLIAVSNLQFQFDVRNEVTVEQQGPSYFVFLIYCWSN